VEYVTMVRIRTSYIFGVEDGNGDVGGSVVGVGGE